MEVLSRGEVLTRILERTDLELFTDRVLDSFWAQPAFQRLHPSRDAVRAWVRWNLDLVIRWLVEGEPPDEVALEAIREHARTRAAEGFPADMIPANFRRAARFAWRAMLEAATEDEQPALLASADLLFDYVDRVSRVYSEVYERARTSAEPDTAGSAEEIAAGALLRRIAADEAPMPEDHQLADRIGLSLERAARPFVIALPDGSAEQHAELAARLRRQQVLAASEGRRVVGLSAAKAPWRGVELDGRAVIAHGPPAIGAECGFTLEELRDVVELAAARGRSGEVEARDYLPELLLRRSPRLASQIRAQVYGALGGEHAELARTLDALVRHSFEKGTVAAVLPVHRNTLRDRIARISEITGIDLEGVEGRSLAWLAWLARRDWPSRPEPGASRPEPGASRREPGASRPDPGADDRPTP